jgi:hypothetical protein
MGEALLQSAHRLGLRQSVGVDRADPVAGVRLDILGAEDGVERAGERHEPARHRQRQPFHIGEAGCVEIDQPGATFLVLLAEAVVQWGSRVTDAAAELLPSVNVPERDVIRAVEDIERHDIEPALTHFAFEACRGIHPRREAMRDRD